MKNVIKTAVLILMLVGTAHCAENAGAQVEQPDSNSKKWAFDLSFKGGTPRELIAAMEKAAAASIRNPEPLNALVPPELAEIRIPPMELRGVTAIGVFETLTFMDPSTRWIPARGGIWVLTHRDERRTQAFYIGHLLKKFKVDDLTTAVKTTWQMGGKEVKAELKYHEDTQLLIARAQPAQISAMAEVITQLQMAVEPVQVKAGNQPAAK